MHQRRQNLRLQHGSAPAPAPAPAGAGSPLVAARAAGQPPGEAAGGAGGGGGGAGGGSTAVAIQREQLEAALREAAQLRKMMDEMVGPV